MATATTTTATPTVTLARRLQPRAGTGSLADGEVSDSGATDGETLAWTACGSATAIATGGGVGVGPGCLPVTARGGRSECVPRTATSASFTASSFDALRVNAP